MKKLLVLLLSLTAVLWLTACTQSPSEPGETTAPSAENAAFPAFKAGEPVPEGCTYITAEGHTLEAGAKPRDPAQTGDQFIAGEFSYTVVEFQGDWTVQDRTPGWMLQLNRDGADPAAKEFKTPIYEEINGLPLMWATGTFQNCAYLVTAPAIPDSVQDLNGTFLNCTSLKDAGRLPAGAQNLTGIFAGCTSLVRAPAIPEGAVLIDRAFEGCTSLLEAPDLSRCKELRQLDRVFKGCTALKEMAGPIPENVGKLPETFMGCTALQKLPDLSLCKDLHEMLRTFRGCTGLGKVEYEIPAEVTLMTGAFSGCTGMNGTVTILNPDLQPHQGQNAFEGCTGLTLTGACSHKTLEALAKAGTDIVI